MTRLSSAALSVAIALSASLAPATIQARSAAPWFTVELAQPTSESRAIAGGVVFNCEGTTCTAPRSGDRPLRVCSELRREVGIIASFSANGSPISEDRLARCNG